MPITISADDPRTIRAIEIAADAARWQACRTETGQPAYRVPSQSDRRQSYVVTQSSCDCADFRRNAEVDLPASEQRACKHILAVRLHTELARAVRNEVRPPTQRRRGHLVLVYSGEPRH